MNVYIKIEFVIDDVMAWHCIQYLLATYQRPTYKKVISTCRQCLYNNGNLFAEQAEFDGLINELPHRDVVDQMVDEWFERIWVK